MMRLGVTSIIVLALSAGSVSFAEQKKKQTVGELLKKARDASRGGKLQGMAKSDTAVPNSQITFQKRQGSVDLVSVKPPRSTEIFDNKQRNQNEVEYERTLDKQIQELYRLTQRYAQNPARGELWLRLAELYVEKASMVDSRKQDIYDKQLKQFLDGKTKVKPKLDTAESKEYNKKAIQLYEWFLRDFPNDEKQSQALFFLGYNYFELGDTKKGAEYYSTLNKKFPSSTFVAESHFALAEYYFENEKWVDSYKEYAYLLKNPKHRLHSFAMYKSAWTLFRMGRTEDAIKYMDYIIRNKGGSGSEGQGKVVNKNRLESEAARDIVVFFADLGDPKRAIQYFSDVTPDTKNVALEKLAYYYSDKGNRNDARVIFQHLIESNPTSKKAFEYQYQIVQNYFYAKNSPQFKEELYRWITDYRKNSNWYETNKGDTEFIANAYKLREQTLRNYILQQHQTAQNSRAKYSQQTALEGYKLYFEEFGDSPQVADMHFFYAELLYDMGRYDEATNHYTWVVEKAPTNKFASKAGQNIILAAEKALPKDEDLQKRVGESIEPIALDPKVEKFIKAADWYMKKFPGSAKEAEIKFRVGRLYYQTNHFTEAEAIFRDIVKKYPRTNYSEYSANLLLDIYNLKKDYAGLEKVGQELLADSALAGTKTGSDIRGVLEKASFKKAQDLEASKDYGKAAEQFEVFAAQNPKSDLAAMAIFNAGVNYERAGNYQSAVKNYQKILSSSDKGAESFKPKVQQLLAKIYQNSGRLEEASVLFEQMAKANPNDKLAPNYYYNAAIMYDSLGENTKALKNYNEYLKTVKSNKDKAEVLFAMAELYRKSNSRTLAGEHYLDYTSIAADSAKKVEAYYRLLEFNKRNKEEADKYKSRMNSIYNRLSGTEKAAAGVFVAENKFADVKNTYNEFVQIRIPADPKKQKAAVDQKLEFINKLNKELGNVIKYDSANEIINSLKMTGDANAHMGQAILNTPLPKELGEEQRKIYQTEVAKIADPFLKKADESYKLTIDRARELGVYNEAYLSALEKMAASNPKEFYDKGEIGNESFIINWTGE